jgi:hypothetical protein
MVREKREEREIVPAISRAERVASGKNGKKTL